MLTTEASTGTGFEVKYVVRIVCSVGTLFMSNNNNGLVAVAVRYTRLCVFCFKL